MKDFIMFFIPLPMKNKKTGKVELVSTISISGVPLGTLIVFLAWVVNRVMA